MPKTAQPTNAFLRSYEKATKGSEVITEGVSILTLIEDGNAIPADLVQQYNAEVAQAKKEMLKGVDLSSLSLAQIQRLRGTTEE